MHSDMLSYKFNPGELITNGLQAGRVVRTMGGLTRLTMVRMWGMRTPSPTEQAYTNLALAGWRIAVTEWTELLQDGELIEERFRSFPDELYGGPGADAVVLRRYTRPVQSPFTPEVAPPEKPSELRGTYSRWTRERDGASLSADILSDVEIVANPQTGRVLASIPDRPMRPDEVRMIGVRLIEAAALADGERAVRDRS